MSGPDETHEEALAALRRTAMRAIRRPPRPCIGPPECSCPTCLRAMIAEHAPHLLDDDTRHEVHE